LTGRQARNRERPMRQCTTALRAGDARSGDNDDHPQCSLFGNIGIPSVNVDSSVTVARNAAGR
jgi:hypothetical protein